MTQGHRHHCSLPPAKRGCSIWCVSIHAPTHLMFGLFARGLEPFLILAGNQFVLAAETHSNGAARVVRLFNIQAVIERRSDPSRIAFDLFHFALKYALQDFTGWTRAADFVREPRCERPG